MPRITLPDGSIRNFPSPITVIEVAADIGSGLAKATLAGKVNNQLIDAQTLISEDCCLHIITSKNKEGLELIRHSTAHLLAMATQSIFPGAQVTIGPVIEDGFYYDFSYKRAFDLDDLVLIETKMLELVKDDLVIQRTEISRQEAIRKFKSLGEKYKVEIISDLPENEKISLYRQGDWVDLCRGPHVPSTGKLKAFKLMRVAGAYWKGDSNNEMLTRIYGTAWEDKKALKAYLHRLEEAKKRDHRRIGKRLRLFHLQDDAPGMIFWHPDGWAIYQQIKKFIRKTQKEWGYQEVKTPQLLNRTLWEKSGHWDKYNDDMFTIQIEEKDIAIKPMNCPCHVQIFNQGLKSYRDLPFRLAEFGTCHRNEASGALHGIMRVRGFVQDDAHIFVTEHQVQKEVSDFIDMLHYVYESFGFYRDNLVYQLSTRPQQRVGSNEVWDKAENALIKALNEKSLPWKILEGEGAFYGPKIEFSLKDCLGRIWQCGTIQVDFSMPNRLGAEYIDEHGSKKTPVMLHRAIIGSFERFIGILLEHFEGSMPVWLAPYQIVIINITNRQEQYAQKINDILNKQVFRVKLDLRNEKIGFKIREHTLNKIPFILVVGDKEMFNETVSVRLRDGKDLGNMSIDYFINNIIHIK